MFYIERTRKNAKLYDERLTFDLPYWFNKDTLDFIFEREMKTCSIIEPKHAIRIKSHVRGLNFDFDNFDYILWRKPNV